MIHNLIGQRMTPDGYNLGYDSALFPANRPLYGGPLYDYQPKYTYQSDTFPIIDKPLVNVDYWNAQSVYEYKMKNTY